MVVHRVSHSPSHVIAALDQHDVGARGRRFAQQICRKHRTGKSCAHDDKGFTHAQEFYQLPDRQKAVRGIYSSANIYTDWWSNRLIRISEVQRWHSANSAITPTSWSIPSSWPA